MIDLYVVASPVASISHQRVNVTPHSVWVIGVVEVEINRQNISAM